MFLEGCPTGPHPTEVSKGTPVGQSAVGPSPAQQLPRHEGRPYDVIAGESLLTILAFRGGTLAKAGHNHVIASHAMRGTIYVPEDAMRTTFEVQIPVAEMTIDEPQLREKEGPDFPPEVPESAKEGTRRNMLSQALLDGEQYPDITIAAERIEADAAGSVSAPGRVKVHAQITVRGQAHSLLVPATYELHDNRVVVSGELPVKQTDLGLTPFSALLGALQVEDEMRVRFQLVARAAQP
jgi:polyisoprenoid-binding protein YceI